MANVDDDVVVSTSTLKDDVEDELPAAAMPATVVGSVDSAGLLEAMAALFGVVVVVVVVFVVGSLVMPL